jgi:small-conductance mechanosensitive channel
LGTALFAGAGILAVIVGFASQKAFSNIISGIFILIFKPFRISDIIEFKDGIKGVVEEITLRHTLIRDYENRRIVIPNSVISDDTIINSNIQDERIRKHIEFGISYDSNVDKAIDIIRDEAEKHPLLIDNRSAEDIAKNVPLVIVRLIALSDFSVNLKAYVWSKGNDDAFVIKCDLLKSVKERFDNEGIEIPFPYRTIVFKKDLNDEENSSK